MLVAEMGELETILSRKLRALEEIRTAQKKNPGYARRLRSISMIWDEIFMFMYGFHLALTLGA